MAFLIISTAVIYHKLTLISLANLQWCMVTRPCITAMIHGHVTAYHCNDTGSTVTHSSFDNDERRVTAFRPVSS